MQQKQGEKILELTARTLCALLVCELLYGSTCRILTGAFPEWSIPVSFPVQALLLCSVLVFSVLVPLCGRFRRICLIVLEFLYPLAAAWYAFRHRSALVQSTIGLCNDYIVHWNKQFKTNYVAFPDQKGDAAYVLLFAAAALFLLCLMLRYVTKVRLFLMFPPLLALSACLLVDAKPQWGALALGFIGTLLLYAQPWDPEQIVWRNRSSRGNLAFLWTAVLALVLLAGSSRLFSGAAAQIPEKKAQFYAYQMQLEDRIKKLGTMGISFAKNEAHVDNATPAYTDEKILTVRASEVPLSNLYLKDFCSGQYENSVWVRAGKAYEKAAGAEGYDSDKLGVMLLQDSLEQLTVRHINTAGEVLDLDSGQISYTLDYHTRSGSALFPYFCDAAENGQVWTDDDRVLCKKRGAKSLTVNGLKANNGEQIVRTGDETASAQPMLDWYGTFARQQYCGGATLSEIERRAKEIAGEYGDLYAQEMAEGNFAERMIGEDTMARNDLYADLLSRVRDNIQNGTSYNLYLDAIPEGTDTIQYFLETGHEGYCMHYASAAALILQELGVPARYASGYVVKPAMFAEADDGYAATVTDRCGHAWVEIYLDGIGWTPFEVTPGYTGSRSTLPTDASHTESLKEEHAQKKTETAEQTQTETATETQTGTETQTETETQIEAQRNSQQQTRSSASEAQTQSGQSSSGPSGLPWIWLLAAAAALAGLSAAIVCLKRAYKNRLLQELRRRQNRRALLRMNRRLYRGLGLRGLGIQTDEEYLRRLIAAYPSVPADDWDTYLQIVRKAVFSNNPLSKEELRFCYRCYKNHRNRANGSRHML